jgi:hypothetical protein
MVMTQKDIKLLWGRSGNRCAICKIELSQDSSAVTSSFTLGEQAHIIGENEESPRGNSVLSAEERESYHNRILLCPNHHTEVDKDETYFSVEKLYYLKSAHELWVRETLADTVDTKLLAKQIAVTSIIDAAVELCRLKYWKFWASDALAPDPRWDRTFPDALFEFRQRVAAAIWPDGFEELRRAATTLAIFLHQAAVCFLEHAEPDDDFYRPYKFYKANGFNPNYRSDLQIYKQWLDNCYHLIYQATCAANWFSDVVRRDINPMFFAESGKFLVIDGPFSPGMSYRASVPEFTEDEKRGLPDSL